MHKKLTVVAVFCGAMMTLSEPVSSQFYSDIDTLSVISAESFPGDTITIPIDLVNTFAIGGFQVRVTFDSWYFTPVAMSLAPRSQVFDLFGSYFDDPGAASFLAASQHPLDYSMPAGSGTVVTLDLAVSSMTPPGSYTIRFENRDSVSHQNALSNTRGDSLVVPVFAPGNLHLPSQAVEDGEGRLPETVSLSQNYPNPFNATTSIGFWLDKSDEVELTVFDLLGRHVATLFSGPAPAGQTFVVWNGRTDSGSDVSSGLFYYRLVNSGGDVIVKKMTLLK